jgi:GNAT superfamily N-acetyltransferase
MAEIEIRFAQASDVAELGRLFTELGFPTAPGDLATRFAAFDRLGEQALVAVSTRRDEARDVAAGLLGLATLHATPVLHRAGLVGRVTALVVDPSARGQGIGRQLMAAAEAWAAARGCVLLEVTSNRRLTAAHAFYERLGYVSTSYRFAKELPAAPGAS